MPSLGSAGLGATSNGKRRGIGQLDLKDSEDIKKNLELVMKLSLWTAQQARVTRAAVVQVLKVPSGHPIVNLTKETMTEYINRQKALKSQGSTPDQIKEEISTPTVHVFNSITKWVIEDPRLPPTKKEALQKSVAKWTPQKVQ
eukprot:10544488-Karenia_brevis.AAC.1